MREKKMLVMNFIFYVVVFGLILWPQASYRQEALESGLSYLEYYTMHGAKDSYAAYISLGALFMNGSYFFEKMRTKDKQSAVRSLGFCQKPWDGFLDALDKNSNVLKWILRKSFEK